MKDFFNKTFSELTNKEVLEIHNLGEKPLDPTHITGLWTVINYRFENLLPTVTYTDKKPFELCKAICNYPGYDTLAHAIVGRLCEMGVIHN